MNFFTFTKFGRTLLLTAVTVIVTVSAVSALDMSVGGGGFFANDFDGGFFSNSFSINSSSGSMGGMPVTLDFTREQKSPWSGGGIKVFFDLKYAEISTGLTFAGGSLKTTSSATFTMAGIDNTLPEEIARELGFANSEIDMSGTFWNIGLLLKYPINLGTATVFPAVGFDGLSCLSASWLPDRTNDADDLSPLWIKFGAGFDYNLNDRMFLRTVALYGIRFTTKAETDASEGILSEIHNSQILNYIIGNGRIGSEPFSESYGLEVRVSVGFRL